MLSSSFLSIFTSKLLLPSLSKPLSFLSPFNMDSFLAYFVRGFLHFQVFHVWSALLCLPFFPKTFYILGKYVVLIISSWRPSLKRFSSTPIQLIYIIFLHFDRDLPLRTNEFCLYVVIGVPEPTKWGFPPIVVGHGRLVICQFFN